MKRGYAANGTNSCFRNIFQCIVCLKPGALHPVWNKPALGIVVTGVEGKEGDSLFAMKSRFIQQKKTRKKVTHSYLKQGVWIKPE